MVQQQIHLQAINIYQNLTILYFQMFRNIPWR